ncbi:MAG: tyrosine-type recombinase/integrase, partial [Steroidobacteraceae bacterium]
MQDERDRAGRFFLKPRGKHGVLYVCWYDKAARQTDGFSTGTADREAARAQLIEHAFRADQPILTADASLAAVMQSYYVNYARDLPSVHAHLAAQRDALEVWGDVDVGDLDRARQLGLVSKLRESGYSDWTIQGRLNRIWAAINWSRRDNAKLIVPEQITAADWKPLLRDRDRTFTLEELAALLNAAAQQPTEARYGREHWWRFLILAIGTASREAALRELTWEQVDLRLGRLHLNPEGRRQTKKRRPTVPIAPTLAAELAAWEHDGPTVITYYGKALATREFFDLLAETAGVDGSPNVIRHTVRTWLAERDVPDSEADVFMGHREEGSATGRRYKHRRPEYLKRVTEEIEALYAALGELVARPFKSRVTVDQPAPEDPAAAALRGNCVATGEASSAKCLNLERETRL